MSRFKLLLFVVLFLVALPDIPTQTTNETVTDNQHLQVKVSGCPRLVAPKEALRPAEPSLRSVFAIFRHGIRSSVVIPPYGRLTKIGKQQMYDVGKTLKTRYRDFLEEYDEDRVVVTSTPKVRTLMSALSVLAGLFPPSTELFSDLRWQPVPVTQNVDEMDKAFIYNENPWTFPKLGLQICPPFGKMMQAGRYINMIPDLRPENKRLYEMVQNYTGDSNFTTILSVLTLWDILHYGCHNGKSLPAWAIEPQLEFQNKPVYPDLLKPIVKERFKNIQFLENNNDMLSFQSGPLFNSIHKTFDAVLTKNSIHKMTLHNSHDSTMNALMWALGLEEPDFVEPGDGVLFELHQSDNSTTVKIFYYDAIHGHTLKELVSPYCPSPCSQQEFKRTFEGMTLQKWEEKCKP